MTLSPTWGLRPPTIRLLTEHHPDGTERWLEMREAYDWHNNKPAGLPDLGCHGAELEFGLRRGPCAVTWCLMTDWYLPETLKAEAGRGFPPRGPFDGLGDITYHSPKALYEDQTQAHADCKHTGGVCYSDGTASGPLFTKALRDPTTIWATLLEWLERTERQVAEQRQMERNWS